MEVFEPSRKYELGEYYGKHIYERKLGYYISTEEFVELMKKHYKYKNNYFQARLKRNNLKRVLD